MFDQPATLPVSKEPINFRKEEIAIEVRNVYHTYDRNFGVQLLRVRKDKPANQSTNLGNDQFRSNDSTYDSNNNPFFQATAFYQNGADNAVKLASFPKNDSLWPGNGPLSVQSDSVKNVDTSSSRSSGMQSPSVRFSGLLPADKANSSDASSWYNRMPSTPGVSATPSLELPPSIRNSSKLILNNMNLTIPRGCIYGLLGPSGCGKTSLLKCITGFQRPTYGRVRVFGCNPCSGLGDVPGRQLGYMPQDYSLHEDLTIAEMMTYFGRVYRLPSKEIRNRIPQLVELLSLPNQNQLVGNLSGGQKRRASFICSVIHMPKLLILDEPTVGCDPVLREKIWNLLVDFAQQHRITVIITTHYIEEAKRSHFVGFMKKGYLMAENTPENLYQCYDTPSLERIFYKLCVNEKIRKGSLVKGSLVKRESNAEKSLKKSQSTVQKQLNQSEEERQRNFYFHNFESDVCNRSRDDNNQIYVPKGKSSLQKATDWIAHTHAMITKNAIQTIRKPEAMVAQFVIPLIVVMFFCVCIGSLPRDIPIGVFNQEQCNSPQATSIRFHNESKALNLLNRTTTTLAPDRDSSAESNSGEEPEINGADLCFSEDLLRSMNSYALKQIRFDSKEKALDEVKAGRLLGVLHLKPNFSEALLDKMNMDNESLIVGDSVVIFEGDVSNRLLLNMFDLLFYEGYVKFIKYALVKLQMNPLLGRLPVDVGHVLFGRYKESDYSGINAYAGPGLLMIIVYSVSFALTGLALLFEKNNGMFERNRVAGVRGSSMLVSLVLVNMTLFAFGLFVLLLVAVHLFEIPLNGSIFAAYGLLLLQCLAGLANGLLLSAVLPSISVYAILGNGLLLGMFILSGALWSVESMPFYVQWLAHLLPVTQPIESLRCILVRGLSFFEAPVYKGFMVSFGWSSVMLIGASFLFEALV